MRRMASTSACVVSEACHPGEIVGHQPARGPSGITQRGVHGQLKQHVDKGLFIFSVLSEGASEVCGPMRRRASRRLRVTEQCSRRSKAARYSAILSRSISACQSTGHIWRPLVSRAATVSLGFILTVHSRRDIAMASAFGLRLRRLRGRRS